MEWVRQWLLSMTCAALIAALADGLMPKGAVRQVGRLVCALMLLCVVLRPVLRVRIPSAEQLMERMGQELAADRERLEQHGGDMLKTLIERESAAYIVDKAAALGSECEVRVECLLSEENLWLPYRAEVSGRLSREQRQRLTVQIQNELGISPERLIYTGGE